nr:MAG TPA: hypothetical protein [Caudoviricetes sp.]
MLVTSINSRYFIHFQNIFILIVYNAKTAAIPVITAV